MNGMTSLERRCAAWSAARKRALTQRTLTPVVSLGAPLVRIDGRTYVDFSSSDPLGFAGDTANAALLAEAAREAGAGALASRLVTGTREAHAALESDLAAYVGAEDALVMSSTYLLNATLLEALAERDDVIISDSLNHASLVDGCRLAKAPRVIVPHLDVGALEEALRVARAANQERQIFIVVESLYSMDGDSPDLGTLVSLAARFGATLVVDEAHAIGVLGPQGRGLGYAIRERARERGVCLLTVMGFGKAFASQGGAVAGPSAVVELLRQRQRGFVYTTALLPALAVALQGLLRRVAGADERRASVLAAAAWLRGQFQARGFSVGEGAGPIIPIRVGDVKATLVCAERLRSNGLWVQAIRPPTVPEGSARLRIVCSAAHTQDHLGQLLSAL